MFSTEVNLLFCFAFYAADAAQSASKGPVRRIFRSETANRRLKLAGIYILCACTKKSLGSPQTPLTQSILWGPPFCIFPGPPKSSQQPCLYVLSKYPCNIDRNLRRQCQDVNRLEMQEINGTYLFIPRC